MTDFGTTDGYVAAMKGALLSVFPKASFVDITHHIPTQDITEAAFQLANVWSLFPPGTVHLTVVDPGVGSVRRAIAVQSAGHLFVTPDNGLLTMILAENPVEEAVVLDNTEFHRSNVSSTFHGRDIFGPVAGAIASGEHSLSDVGSPIDPYSIVQLPWVPVTDEDGKISAPVVSVDRFGNCRTLITESHIPGDHASVFVSCRDVTVRGIFNTYSQVPNGKTLALFGSHGGLELAVRGGSASRSWDIRRGDEVVVFTA